jgi:hypothetical protein
MISKSTESRIRVYIRIGIYIGKLLEKIKQISNELLFKCRVLMAENQFGLLEKKEEILKAKKEIHFFLASQIPKINSHIKSLNKDLKFVKLEKKVSQLSSVKIEKSLQKLIENKNDLINTTKTIDEWILKALSTEISQELDEIPRNISEIGNEINRKTDSFNLKKIDSKYLYKVKESIDLYLLGYKNTALLVLGRVFEEILTKYLLKLKKDQKILITKEDIIKMKLVDKINFLKSKKFISEKDGLILSKLKFDRNVGAHFNTKSNQIDAEKESEFTIKLSLSILNKYITKL